MVDDQLVSTWVMVYPDSVVSHLSNPKPGHTTGGSGRGAWRGGGAGSSRTGC